MEPGPYPHLVMIVDEPTVARFYLLLQQGVKIRRRIGCSVDAFLREELGARRQTIEKVQSIMLDGRPVDDIGTAVLHDCATLALSAAMPGLVGATLRRGGAYAGFRSGITYREAGPTCAPGEGWVTVKLFNLLMAELGPSLLQRGVLVRAAEVIRLVEEHAQELRKGCSVTLDGMPARIGTLERGTALAGKERVFLTVATGQGAPGRRI